MFDNLTDKFTDAIQSLSEKERFQKKILKTP